MADNHKPTSVLNAEIDSTRSDKFQKIYSNAANLEVTVWDFTFFFGQLIKRNNKPCIEYELAVTMSPQHAKVLSQILAQNVKDYEANVGEIKLPQPDVAPVSSAKQ